MIWLVAPESVSHTCEGPEEHEDGKVELSPVCMACIGGCWVALCCANVTNTF